MKITKPLPWLLLLASCKVREESLPGTYRLKRSPKTSFVLHADKSFTFTRVYRQPGKLLFGKSGENNFRTEGNWKLAGNRLYLNSNSSTALNEPGGPVDQLQENTSISSFSFWNQYGDPVAIRFIKFPPDRVKLHLNNTISFFAEDFAKTDTLEFHFYGYAPYRWTAERPGSKESNQVHSITLPEETRPGFFNNYSLVVNARRLKDKKSHAVFKHVKKFRIE